MEFLCHALLSAYIQDSLFQLHKSQAVKVELQANYGLKHNIHLCGKTINVHGKAVSITGRQGSENK
jgi:hypothetical protein